MKIILGSKSERRKLVLEKMGYEFEVMSPDIDEKAIRIENPKELTLAIAKAKAEALKEKITEPAILITADLVVVCNGKIREKPVNEKEARDFLASYEFFPAETVGAIVVTNTANGKQASALDFGKILLNSFSEKDIDEIIKDGNVFNLAGGFTIIGDLWEKHVKKIEGTRDSMLGLSKELTKKLISEVI